LYNESINLTWDILNLTVVTEMLNFNFTFLNNGTNYTDFFTSFIADYDYVGNYTIYLNATDNSSEIDQFEFNFTIVERNELPQMGNVSNFTTSILDEFFYYDFNATDRENPEGDGLEYSLINLTVDAPVLNINSVTGVIDFNFSNNQSYAGVWEYNISVNDSLDIDSEVFRLDVHGFANVTNLEGVVEKESEVKDE